MIRIGAKIFETKAIEKNKKFRKELICLLS
jgi:hypothetical protein